MNLEKAIKRVKKAGFTHVKLELEAHLDMGNHKWGQISSIEEAQALWSRELSLDAKLALDYHQFYNDGSVDTEVTLTVPVEKVEHFEEYVKQFSKLRKHSRAFDIRGSGIHIALMKGPEYPSEFTLDETEWRNFKGSAEQFLLALYFLSSVNDKSRALRYRLPRVSATNKYSAIYSKALRFLEFRTFETCYGRPRAVLSYFDTVSRFAPFYAPKASQTGLKEAKTVTIPVGVSLSRFFQTKQTRYALEKQLTLLGYSRKEIDQLKKDRNFPTVKKFRHKEYAKRARAELEATEMLRSIEDEPGALEMLWSSLRRFNPVSKEVFLEDPHAHVTEATLKAKREQQYNEARLWLYR